MTFGDFESTLRQCARQVWSSQHSAVAFLSLSVLTFVTHLGWHCCVNGQVSQTVVQKHAREIDQSSGRAPLQPIARSQSCSSSACHGSLVGSQVPTEIRYDEYFVWLEDPHAKAYRALSGDLAKSILVKLGVADDRLRPLPGQQASFKRHWNSCLACHETNAHLSADSVLKDTVTDVDQLHNVPAEGVSCESCHGDARDWLHQHYRKSSKASVSDDEKRGRNFVVPDDIAAIVQRCTNCHVGSPAGDVNHELIAAGHPALRFEYAWYKSRLAKHWKTNRRVLKGSDQRPISAESPAREWLIGQVVSSIAAIEQLERRTAIEEDRTDWPEFAEYNCFSCHHDLRYQSWRRDRGLPGLSHTGSGRLVVPWANWNLELVQGIADQMNSVESQRFSAAFGHLRDEFQKGHRADPHDVHRLATVARTDLERWLKNITSVSDQQVAILLQGIIRKDPNQLVTSWERVASTLLGFAAHQRSGAPISEKLKLAMDRIRFDNADDHVESPREFLMDEQDRSLKVEQWIELLNELADSIGRP